MILTLIATVVALAIAAAPAAGSHATAPEAVENVPVTDAEDPPSFERVLVEVTLVDDGADVAEDADVDADFLMRHADELARGEAVASDWDIAGTLDGIVVIEEMRVRHVQVDALAPAIAAEAQARTGESVSVERVRDADFAAHAGNDALVDVVAAAAAHGAAFDAPDVDPHVTRADLGHAAEAQEPVIVSRDVVGFVGADGVLLVERAFFVVDAHDFRTTVNEALGIAHDAGMSAEERLLASALGAHERVRDTFGHD